MIIKHDTSAQQKLLQITTNYCSKSGCWNQANGWKYYGEIVGDFSQYSYSCVRAQTSGGACKKSHCGWLSLHNITAGG